MPARQLVLEADQPLGVGSRALDLLIALVDRPGEVSKEELLARAWPNTVVDGSNLRVQIAALRRALGDGRASARYVAAVPGRGYRFVAPVSRRQSEMGGRQTGVGDGLCPPVSRERSVAKIS